ncbi:hypothetical protein D3C76_765750 [compost metagenome]
MTFSASVPRRDFRRFCSCSRSPSFTPIALTDSRALMLVASPANWMDMMLLVAVTSPSFLVASPATRTAASSMVATEIACSEMNGLEMSSSLSSSLAA